MLIFTLNDDKFQSSNVAPNFSTSTNYAVDDIVIYNNGLYKCTSPHSAGVWNASHFESVKIFDIASTSSNNITYEFDGTDLNITAVANNGVFELSGTTLLVTLSAS